MNSTQIIVIEDSPPPTPVLNNLPIQNNKPFNASATSNFTNIITNKTGLYTEFPTSVEKTKVWIDKTNSFIKNTMNLAVKKSYSSGEECEIIDLATGDRSENNPTIYQQNISQQNNITQTSTQINNYVTFHCDPHFLSECYSYNFPPGNFGCYAPFSGFNGQRPFFKPALVIREPNFYPDTCLQTPVKIYEYDYNQQNYMKLEKQPVINYDGYNSSIYDSKPEYIDINNLMHYNYFSKCPSINVISPSINTEFNKTTAECFSNLISSSPSKVKRCASNNRNSVPLFLKRNRSSNNSFNKMKNIESPLQNVERIPQSETDFTMPPIKPNQTESNDDDLDVVCIGVYSREPSFPVDKPTVHKLPAVEEKPVLQQEPSAITDEVVVISDENTDSKSSSENKEEKKKEVKVRRKRKHEVTAPRRNPKRQVQIEKDYMKLLDGVIQESKKELKARKTRRPNKITIKEEKPVKRPLKQVANCGAVYHPPSPLAKHHIRDWPATGMHERPEYNSVSGQIEQFDTMIRKISNSYQVNSNKENVQVKAPRKNSKIKMSEMKKNFPRLCHEMFHHVLAYSATVKSLDKGGAIDADKDTSTNDVLNLSDKNKTSEKNMDTNVQTHINELMTNSILLYCVTNNLEQKHVSKYIQSLKPEDVVEWSYEQFAVKK